VLTLSQRRGDVRTSLVARGNRQAMSEVETFWIESDRVCSRQKAF
jgi:hypothetical protein